MNELDEILAGLVSDRDDVVSEIGVLRSIYGDDAIVLWKDCTNENRRRRPDDTDVTIRYELRINLLPPYDELDKLRLLVTIPSSYPSTSPPQLQLLSRYIGAYSVDSSLFGSILRIFISKDGVEWSPDTVCVFDGVEHVRERCANWHTEHINAEKAGTLLREDEKESKKHEPNRKESPPEGGHMRMIDPPDHPVPTLDGIHIVHTEPIHDRKSTFIGRACRITHPSQVPIVLSHLRSDRKIGKATHPTINAWRCTVDGLIHQDNMDDGETAAGSRLAHLIQILDLDNVLVIVTRWYGGIHLGSDRFKYINQVARGALELGGFLDNPEERNRPSRIKKRT
ncbi:UPF0029-domain-containing protein [Rickenella mellea]|uniref:UPF0029-domain-containing protein n=1 Tax=Rickenella mellea TaxID=50990 RepID=A0A4R5XG74_9AGAM|nr:UPF0029-domain-containing protein [Rickenella mellea]